MPVFVSDSFTDTSLTALASHTGETGATWAKHPNFTGSLFISENNRVRGVDGDVASVYYASGTPDSADYYVETQLYCASSVGGYPGVVGRMNTSTSNFYMAIYRAGAFELWKYTNGSLSQLGTGYTQTLTAGNTYALRLDMVGTTIRVLIDGVERINQTDSTHTSAGKAGLVRSMSGGSASSTTGWHDASFEAATAGSGSSAPKRGVLLGIG